MKLASFVAALSVTLLPTFVLAAPEGKDVVKKEYALPADKETPILEYDTLGGLTTERISREPQLTIYPDGRVKMPACFKGQRAFEGKISPAELQEFLTFALEKQKFFEHDEEKVRAHFAKGPQIPPPTDSITTTIRIRAEGKDKSVSSSEASERSPVEDLRRFAAVRDRVWLLKGVLQIGKPQVAEYLKQINAQLKETHPDAKPLEEADLKRAYHDEKASSLEFVRRVPTADGKSLETSASVYAKSGSGPRVGVAHGVQ
jgi:hypothetical protein